MGEERDKNNRDALLCTIPTMKSENLNKTTCEEGGGRWEFREGDTRDATLVFVAFGASGIAQGEVDGVHATYSPICNRKRHANCFSFSSLVQNMHAFFLRLA